MAAKLPVLALRDHRDHGALRVDRKLIKAAEMRLGLILYPAACRRVQMLQRNQGFARNWTGQAALSVNISANVGKRCREVGS